MPYQEDGELVFWFDLPGQTRQSLLHCRPRRRVSRQSRDAGIRAVLFEFMLQLGSPFHELRIIVRLAAQPGNGDVIGGGPRRQSRCKEQENRSQTTPHLRRKSHSADRNVKSSRNTTGMFQRSFISRDVIPASEYEISSANLLAFLGV